MELNDNEVWRPIPAWETFYEASTLGRVRSLKRKVLRGGHWMKVSEKVLNPNVHHSGYLRVNLQEGGRRSEQLVHWIIAATFLGQRPEGMEIRHLDGDPANNSLSNLVYGTSKENKLDIKQHGTHAMKQRTHCPLGHELAGHNLVAAEALRGHRKCRACNTARARAHRSQMPPAEFRELAHGLYQQYSSLNDED